jgi:hypothetical protein
MEPGHCQQVDHQVFGHVHCDRQANDHTVEQVQPHLVENGNWPSYFVGAGLSCRAAALRSSNQVAVLGLRRRHRSIPHPLEEFRWISEFGAAPKIVAVVSISAIDRDIARIKQRGKPARQPGTLRLCLARDLHRCVRIKGVARDERFNGFVLEAGGLGKRPCAGTTICRSSI